MIGDAILSVLARIGGWIIEGILYELPELVLVAPGRAVSRFVLSRGRLAFEPPLWMSVVVSLLIWALIAVTIRVVVWVVF